MITIDISRDKRHSRLLSRRVWAALYPEYISNFKGKIPTPQEFDSFLCDLIYFEKHIKESWGSELVLYWRCGPRGYTDMVIYDSGEPELRKITILFGNRIVIQTREEYRPVS